MASKEVQPYMDPELDCRTAPQGLHQPNLQQLDTSNNRCPTRQCSGPSAFSYDLNRLFDWVNKWQMNFNVDKCAVMHIGNNNIQHNYTMVNHN